MTTLNERIRALVQELVVDFAVVGVLFAGLIWFFAGV